MTTTNYETRCPDCGHIDVQMFGSALVNTRAPRFICGDSPLPVASGFVEVDGEFLLNELRCNLCHHVFEGDPNIRADIQMKEAGWLVETDRSVSDMLTKWVSAVTALNAPVCLSLDGMKFAGKSVSYSCGRDCVRVVCDGAVYEVFGASVKYRRDTEQGMLFEDDEHGVYVTKVDLDKHGIEVPGKYSPVVYTSVEIETTESHRLKYTKWISE